MNLTLDQIRLDGGTQARAEINEATVSEYAEAMIDEAILPPVTVFYDGVSYWLVDGFHRFHAHRRIGALSIEATVQQADQRAAILASLAANVTHGLRRTNADKRKAVQTLLADPEWSTWSDREIARRCGISSHGMVSAIRSSLVSDTSEKDPRTYTTKHGTVATMDTAQIGQGRSGERDDHARRRVEPNSTRPEKVQSDYTEAPDKVEVEFDSTLTVPADLRAASPNTPTSAPTPAPVVEELVPMTGRGVEQELEEAGLTEVDKLQIENDELRERLSDMADDLTHKIIVEQGNAAVDAELKRLQSQLRVTESQRDEYMRTCAELRKEVKSLRRRLGEKA